MSYAPTQSPITARSTSFSDTSSLQVPNMQRHRKAVSTGGGRAWSDAEEAYLIETREHKMPYKHIAAQLKKTELACRLHYHQLSFGSKSRRTPSLASIHSSMRSDRSSMTPPSSLRQPTPQRPLPSFSPPESPPDDQSTSTPSTTISNTSDPTLLTSKPILPRPNIPSNNPYPHPHHNHQHRSAPSTSTSSSSTKRLRLNTSPPQRGHQNAHVDLPLLDRLYDTHRLHFWSTIASAYGTGLSPATLEDAWRASHSLRSTNHNNSDTTTNNGNGSALPPTPRGSPSGETPAGKQQYQQEGCYSAVTDPGRWCTSSSTTSSATPAGGFTAVNGAGWAGGRASEPPSAPAPQPRSSSTSYANGSSGRRGVVGSIRSLLNNGGEESREAEQGRKLREIEREYGDVVVKRSASASEGSTPTTTTGQMEGVATGGPQAVETTA